MSREKRIKNKKEPKEKKIKINSDNKPLILRGIAATLIWALLILAFVNGTVARNYSNKALSKIDVATKFSETFFEEQKAIEVAKLFLNDFLEFTDRTEYQKRMAKYSTSFKSPTGRQHVNSIYFISKEIENDIYRIILTVNLDREAFAENTNNISKVNIISNDDEGVRYFKEIEETYMVSVDKNLALLGTPVIQPLQTTEGSALKIKNKDYSPEFKVFVGQVLDLYFKGEDLINFTSPKTEKLLSIGNYEVIRHNIDSYEENDKEARAVIKATVKSEEITYEQTIIIEAVLASGKWLLTRIGGF